MEMTTPVISSQVGMALLSTAESAVQTIGPFLAWDWERVGLVDFEFCFTRCCGAVSSSIGADTANPPCHPLTQGILITGQAIP